MRVVRLKDLEIAGDGFLGMKPSDDAEFWAGIAEKPERACEQGETFKAIPPEWFLQLDWAPLKPPRP